MLMKASVTELTPEDRGAHIIVGSHGGASSGLHAVHCRVASLICHDAGVGLEEAGVAALDILGEQGVPAAAVSHRSAHIGAPRDMFDRGVLSRVNAPAGRLGIAAGMRVREAGTLLEAAASVAPPVAVRTIADHAFGRHDLTIETPSGTVRITIVDSASSVRAEDDGAIVVTGSHGGLPGGEAARALKARPLLVAFNDAGIGIDGAGTSRLPVLGEMGIAAVCVGADSARIGDGLSTYRTGVISTLNESARALGAYAGMTLAGLIAQLAGHVADSESRMRRGESQ